MKDNFISLSKFLSRYACVEGKDLKKLTHEDVEVLFPQLKRTSFEIVFDNPDLLYSGKVLMVYDGKSAIPYIVPKMEIQDMDMMCVSREEEKVKPVDDKVYDYTSMSIYELRCLLVRKFNSTRNQVCARKELNKRGVEITKKYKRIKIDYSNMED